MGNGEKREGGREGGEERREWCCVWKEEEEECNELERLRGKTQEVMNTRIAGY